MRVNQVITAVWGLYFFVCALISVYRRLSGDSDFAWSYAWVALALLATLFTARFPAWYRTRALRAAPQGAPPGGD